jgi:hypothetical protein
MAQVGEGVIGRMPCAPTGSICDYGGEEVGTAIRLPCPLVNPCMGRGACARRMPCGRIPYASKLRYGEFFTEGMNRVAGSVLKRSGTAPWSLRGSTTPVPGLNKV